MSLPPRDIEIAQWFLIVILTVVPVLSALTVEGIRFDICITLAVFGKRFLDEKN